MHELSLCQDMLDQIADIARTHHAEKVLRITVNIGPLSGVEPQLLESAFSMACVGTESEQAELVMEQQPISVWCYDCAQASEAKANNLTCAHCGGYNTHLQSGDELILARVELEGVA